MIVSSRFEPNIVYVYIVNLFTRNERKKKKKQKQNNVIVSIVYLRAIDRFIDHRSSFESRRMSFEYESRSRIVENFSLSRSEIPIESANNYIFFLSRGNIRIVLVSRRALEVFRGSNRNSICSRVSAPNTERIEQRRRVTCVLLKVK